MAKKEKKPVHRVQMTEGKRAIIQQLLQEYEIETAEDIQDALCPGSFRFLIIKELLKNNFAKRVLRQNGGSSLLPLW